MAASIFEALELGDWLRAAVAGWRYLFSRSFRIQTHARWRQERRWHVAWDVICGMAGMAFTGLIFYAIVSLFVGWEAR